MAKGSSETVLGKNVRIRGRISGEGDLVVQGSIEGDVTLRGDFTLDEGAQATSSITAHAVVVAGALEGGVVAETEFTITASGSFRGDVSAPQVNIEDGAVFAGRLDAEFDLPAELMRPSKADDGAKRR